MIRAPHMPSPEVAEALRRDDADDLALVGTDVLIAWHHLPHAPVRYAVVAATPSGIVIAGNHPLLHGLSGTIVRRLPCGTAMDLGCSVRRSRRAGAGEPRYETTLTLD